MSASSCQALIDVVRPANSPWTRQLVWPLSIATRHVIHSGAARPQLLNGQRGTASDPVEHPERRNANVWLW
jgi:hypothetical protein